MKIVFTFLLLLSLQQVRAQSLAINTDGSTANASALLDVKSTAKGMLIPRMRSVERTAIAAPAGGLLVYDIDSLAFSYYNGTVWTFLKADADISKGWSVKGNSGTDTAINFLGTKDNMPLRFKLNNNWAGQWDAAKSNFFIGTGAGSQITTGINNIGIGDSSLSNNTSRSGLTAVGHNSLTQNTNGFNNTAMGFSTLNANLGGNQNTAVGYSALTSNTSGYRNTAIGSDAMSFSVSGHSNVAIGAEALSKTNGSWNIGIGNIALKNNTTGVNNISIGQSSLTNNITGSDNVAIGTSVLTNNGTGYSNVGIGSKALFNVGNKSNLVAVGDSSLFNNGLGATLATQAIQNTAIGSKALYANTVGTGNTALGFNALNYPTTGTNNTAIGTYSNIQFEGLTNATAIGAIAIVAASNSMVLGSINGVGGANADTKVGIGVTSPTEKLEIGNGRLRFRGNFGFGSAHGITWTNNAGTIDRAFMGMETDDLFGIFGLNFSTWNIRVHNTTGEMGIFKQPGTASDQSRLQVKQSNTGATRGIGIETAINTNRWDMWVDNNAAPDYNFSYNGAIRGYFQNATGNYIVVSDRRFKKDVSDFSGSLSTLNKLKTYQYHYLDNSAADPLSIGFMAQDVQKLFPDAVSEKTMDDGKKRLGLNYQYFTVLAIKGLQEQQQIIDNQNKKIENLQAQIDEIKKMIKKD